MVFIFITPTCYPTHPIISVSVRAIVDLTCVRVAILLLCHLIEVAIVVTNDIDSYTADCWLDA